MKIRFAKEVKLYFIYEVIGKSLDECIEKYEMSPGDYFKTEIDASMEEGHEVEMHSLIIKCPVCLIEGDTGQPVSKEPPCRVMCHQCGTMHIHPDFIMNPDKCDPCENKPNCVGLTRALHVGDTDENIISG